jgi:hypothetical protein
MPTLTVNLNKTYSLSLTESKAAQVDWEAMAGQNKLRRFFVHPKWQDYIARVSVSSAGVKGGVFFLEAYEVTPAAFERQFQALGVTIDPSAAWRRLHAEKYLTGGMFAHGAEVLPAVVNAQVMQPGFILTDTSFGRSATARNNLLTALQNAAQLRKRYVVKGTNEPGRTLFAEYVLNTIGKAKIPKSLVLEIDPSRPHNHADPSEGMIMLNLINTLRNPQADAARYNAAYTNLHNGAQTVVDYLVVQKLLAGDMLADKKTLRGLVVEFMCDQKIIVDTYSFSADVNFAGVSSDTLGFLVQELGVLGCLSQGLVAPDHATRLNGLTTLGNKRNEVGAVLAAALPTLATNNPNNLLRQNYEKSFDAQFDQLVHDLQNQTTTLAQALTDFLANTLQPIIDTNVRILSDVQMMWNTARVHFADALLGNADRFEDFNTGNMFYVTRQAVAGTNKASNPVGCIDNDSFLPTYLPRRGFDGYTTAVNYVTKVLKPDVELWGWDTPKPPGMVMAPNMSVFDVLDYDNWFTSFFERFFNINSPDDLPMAVLALYGPRFFAPGDTLPFLNTQDLPGWRSVRRRLREGVANALANYLDTGKDEFQSVYEALTARYYPGPNFEFTAFEIRDQYLTRCQVDRQNWTVVQPSTTSLKKLQADIAVWLTATRMAVNPESDAPRISPLADGALRTGIQLRPALAADEANIRRLLLTMSVSDQERLLPNPFASGAISHFVGTPRTEFERRWASLKSKYANRLAVVICTLLQRFWNEYIAEVGYLTYDRGRILGSKAFDTTETLALQVSAARIAKDEGHTLGVRQEVLGNKLNLANYVTAS